MQTLIMKKILFLALLCMLGVGAVLSTTGLYAQTSVPLEEAAKHVGDSVTITGKVFGARYLENGEKQPTLINLGAAFPRQLLTVVIFGPERKLFSFKPEEEFINKTVMVTGKITLYRNKPQIVIYQAAQIKEQGKK